MKVADLKKYKDGLYTSLSRDLDAFEKNFILISSGILAFSITFIKDIVKIEEADCLWLLFIGWFFILSAIGLMMYAFLSSVNGSNKLWKIVDDYMVNNNKFDSEADLTDLEASAIKKETNNALYKIKKSLSKLRTFAIGFFISGVALFSIFVAINLLKENSKSKNKENTIKIINSKKSEIIISEKKMKKLETVTKDSVSIIK